MALFIPLPSTQFSSLSFGNLSHLKLFGHEKPKRFISPLQPCLALLQRERQGGTGVAKFFDTKQYGAYTEHRKWAKSLEQPTFTKGVNWDSSIAASCWELYTCQLSRLRRESHACRLKTSISRRLTPAGQFLTPDSKM